MAIPFIIGSLLTIYYVYTILTLLPIKINESKQYYNYMGIDIHIHSITSKHFSLNKQFVYNKTIYKQLILYLTKYYNKILHFFFINWHCITTNRG